MKHSDVSTIIDRLRTLANEQGKLAAGMDQLEAHRLADNIRQDCLTMNRAADLLEAVVIQNGESLDPSVLHPLLPAYASWLD